MSRSLSEQRPSGEVLDGPGSWAVDGAVAMVRGATSHVGAAVAHRLAGDGVALALVGEPHETDALEALRDLVNERGGAGQATVVTGDLHDPQTPHAVTETSLTRLGRLDYMVDLVTGPRTTLGVAIEASAQEGAPASETPLGAVRRSYLLAAAAARRIAPGGSLVLTVPLLTARAAPDVAAAHGSLQMLVRSLALELAPYRIRANGVMPGVLDVDDADPVHIPLGRAGHTGEVAEAVAFLLSPDASFITGTVLAVDGALTCAAVQSQPPPAGPNPSKE